MKKFFRNNSLSIVFLLLFVFAIIGQAITGLNEHNQEMEDEGGTPVSMGTYLKSGHFIQSTFENWESEFLQMAMFVILTMFLYQKGSSESKDPEKDKEEVDREPNPRRKDAPWPVHKGGILLAIYQRSLSYALVLIFLLSFLLHWFGSLKDFNESQLLKGKPEVDAVSYLGYSRFWFESFQNWQSEFLSIAVIVVFTIFLREKGSPQSKPVDAPNSETGE